MPADLTSAERGRALRATAALARGGDVAAFTDLVTALHPQVYRWALTFARDADDADEIAQETFVLVHRNLVQYRGDSSLEGWVYGITRNVALQRTRTQKRRAWLSDSMLTGMDTVYNTDPGGRVDRQRVAAYIRHFFTVLPPRQREIFDLVDLQGHDPAEVAQIIGMKPATVRANLFKARASIRAHLLVVHHVYSGRSSIRGVPIGGEPQRTAAGNELGEGGGRRDRRVGEIAKKAAREVDPRWPRDRCRRRLCGLLGERSEAADRHHHGDNPAELPHRFAGGGAGHSISSVERYSDLPSRRSSYAHDSCPERGARQRKNGDRSPRFPRGVQASGAHACAGYFRR